MNPRRPLLGSARVLLHSAGILFLVSASLLGAQEPEGRIVEAFVGAFNERDLSALRDLAHPEIEWISVRTWENTVEASGWDAVEVALRSYFASCPSCRSVVRVTSTNGPWVTAIETASWVAGGVDRSQSSTSVYEIRDRRVRRVWYYPPVAAR